MAQPGVVIEDESGHVLYHWAIVPSEMNMGGASDRPLVADIIGALDYILTNTSKPEAFLTTDMAYLQENHPQAHQMVQAYINSLK